MYNFINGINTNFINGINTNFGFFIGFITLSKIIVLDLCCSKKNICPHLYFIAFLYNVFYLLIISPILYYYNVKYFCNHYVYQIKYQIIIIIKILFTQSILYFYIHKLMHTPILYNIHKFHHKFNKYVIPMSANAVSIYEFLLAYIFPFIIASFLFTPDLISLNISIFIVSTCNIIIHTPLFLKLSYYYPRFLVSPKKTFSSSC